MNPSRPEYVLFLIKEVRGTDAWGTDLGAVVFAQMNRELIQASQGTLVWIDYKGLIRSDASFQREAVVETIRKHRPRLLFVARNLEHPDLRSNLALALEKRGEALLVQGEGRVDILGKSLAQNQLRLLAAVNEKPGFTSALLTEPPYSLNPSTASSQLTTLWRAGLLDRVEGTAASGGREFSYFPIP